MMPIIKFFNLAGKLDIKKRYLWLLVFTKVSGLVEHKMD